MAKPYLLPLAGRGRSGAYRNGGSLNARSLRLCSLPALGAQVLAGADADLEVRADRLLVEVVGLAGQLDLAVERLVGDAQQRAVGDAEAIALRGDGGAFHLDRDRAALATGGWREWV